MAKRKKAPRRSSNQATWYKKIILGCLACGVLLGIYCYFTAQSEHIPVIGSMNYPKRTPGSIQSHSRYAVYDRLAESDVGKTQKTSTVSRLLPPNEVPEFPEEPVLPKTVPQGIVAPAASTPSSQSPSGGEEKASKERARTTKDNATVVPKINKNSLNGVQGKVKKPINPKVESPNGKKKSGTLEKNAEKHAPVRAKKKVLGIQIGEVYEKESQAKALLGRLVKKGGVRHGIRPILQKAKHNGVFRYRVILSGHCSKEDWAAYRSWLMRQDI